MWREEELERERLENVWKQEWGWLATVFTRQQWGYFSTGAYRIVFLLGVVVGCLVGRGCWLLVGTIPSSSSSLMTGAGLVLALRSYGVWPWVDKIATGAVVGLFTAGTVSDVCGAD